ncbi:hypothetical protein EXN66_Car019806 [Channa argus]|uniref:Uncharacterized protein n=1 Tax=Channa argus TaxID=215402 RepID=A0A6G1QPG2_CHAAH|nr:hypothetical protein EXN66_Car019806 [Channa argus]
MAPLWYLSDDRPPSPHEYCIWFSFEAPGPCRVTCDRGTGRKQGSQPGNRLVKEPATTASSMGHEAKRRYTDPKMRNTLLLLLSLSGTSVSVILAAALALTPPDGEPAGSNEVLPTEMAGITPLE